VASAGRAICKSAPRSRQITTPTPHHSVFYRPDALPVAQPTASKHWRQTIPRYVSENTDAWVLPVWHSHQMVRVLLALPAYEQQGLCICRASVRPSIAARAHNRKPAGLLLWARPAAYIDRLLHGAQQRNEKRPLNGCSSSTPWGGTKEPVFYYE